MSNPLHQDGVGFVDDRGAERRASGLNVARSSTSADRELKAFVRPSAGWKRKCGCAILPSMSIHPYEVKVHSDTRDDGKFAYLISRSDNARWLIGSTETFGTKDEAAQAGYERVMTLLEDVS